MTEDKRFTYSDVWGWNIDGFLNVMNGLDKKNNKLKEQIKELRKENKQLQIEVLSQSEEIEILSDENERLKQPKYVFGICDGKITEKRFNYDYKTGRMKDTQSNSQATKDMRILETIINNACYSYEKKIKELETENKMLKATIGRNEAYIKKVTTKGKWSNTGDIK